MAFARSAWIESAWAHFLAEVPTASNALRENLFVAPPIPRHVVPRAIIDAVAGALYDTISTAVVTIALEPGMATTGAPLVPYTTPDRGALLIPTATGHGELYRLAVGGLGIGGFAAVALVEGLLNYYLEESSVMFDPLEPPYGLALEPTGMVSVAYDQGVLEASVRTALTATGRFFRWDIVEEGLTPEMERNIVISLSNRLAEGVRSIQLLPPIVWNGTPTAPPSTNPDEIEVDGHLLVG